MNRINQENERSDMREFLHHLHDTLILLGAEKVFADLVESPETINDCDVKNLRRYNCDLINKVKEKLENINKITISVRG